MKLSSVIEYPVAVYRHEFTLAVDIVFLFDCVGYFLHNNYIIAHASYFVNTMLQ